jgi:membrane peptidoglycan carboxypeptidase
MSIEDKKTNDHLEEDTLALRAVSSGNRKNKKHSQTRTSDQSPNISADERSSETKGTGRTDETKQKSNGADPKATSQVVKEEKEAISAIPASSTSSAKSIEEKEPTASSAKKDIAEQAAPVVPEVSKPETKEPPTPEVPKTPPIKEEAAPIVPKPQTREPSAPAIPKRPQAKGQSAPAIPKRPQSRERAASPVPKTPQLTENKEEVESRPATREQAAPQIAARKEAALETPAIPLLKEQLDTPLSTSAPEKDIADISTTAISKQEVEEGLAAARAKKDIADQPTTTMSGQKVEKPLDTPRPEKETPPPEKKDVADISTTAISKQEVEEGLKDIAAARAKKEASSKPGKPTAPPKPTIPPAGPEVGRTPDQAVAVLTRNATLPGSVAASRLDSNTPHRIRVNRMLMRKRRQERTKEIAPRLVTVVAIILIVLTTLLSSGAGAAYAYYEAQLPLLNGIADHSLFQTTHIYDRNGKLLYELYDQQLGRGRRTYVNYNDISPLLVNATIAIEDRTFWTNDGVDPVGIARASVELAQNNGDVQGGGSTVTQQLIKNQFFDNQPRTFQLKGEEAMLAAGLTQQYPKWKIMEMYLNTVYYGNINYGAESAAEDYFGLMPKCDKTHCLPAVGQLDLAQASMLAGLPQSPTAYEPIDNKPAALTRQKEVLQAMVDTGKITKVQAQQAANEMAKYNFISHYAQRRGSPQAPHFVNYVINQLAEQLGAQTLVSGGFNVYTTLDLDLEKKVESIVYYHLYQQQDDNYVGFYGILSRDKNVNDGAVVVMNPNNGEILAMDGSANYNANNPTINGQVNAALTLRQPGSSIKPVVYATAFEMGWSPGTIVPDHKTIYPYPDPAPPQYYTPQNYDQTFHTSFPMTIRTAVSNSYNIPALDTLMYAGIPNVLNMAGRLGLPEIANVPASQVGVSLALGAKEVSLLHLTNAYSTFANQGVRVPPVSILEITDNQGRPLYKYDESHPQGIRAVGPDVAFLINSMLSDKAARYHEFSPGNPLELDRPAAAKTGTTDSFKDNWTMGYTPHLAVGVWVGNSDNEQMNNIIGITGAGPIWHDVMEYASQRYNFPPDDFIKPKNVHAGTVSATTGLVPHPGESTVTDWYIDGTLPTIQGSNYTVTSTCTKKHCKNNNNNGNNGNNNNNNGN